MPQGCNLILSEEDKERWRLDGELPDQERDQILWDIEGGRQTEATYSERIAEMSGDLQILEDLSRRFPDTAPFLKASVGNPKLDGAMAKALPGGLRDIFQADPEAVGIFNHAGKGAARRVTLLDGEQANGAAYEILMASRLARNSLPEVALRKGGDRLAFGHKLQARYALRQGTVTDGWQQFEIVQPRRATAEADIEIYRGESVIGIDLKYNTTGQAKYIDHDELQAAAAALRTGEATEWHYVTNGSFGPKTKELVENANKDLRQEWLEEYGDPKYFSEAERALLEEPKACPQIFLHEHQEWK